MTRFLMFFILVLFLTQPFSTLSAKKNIRDYESTWDRLLKKHVYTGTKKGIRLNMVNYKKLKNNSDYKNLIESLKTFNISSIQTRKEKLAFWINAYNIGAVKMITDNYPLKSIKDKSSLFKSVWNIKILNIGGKTYSLGHIEHKILRKMNEPRIHFAIVCASLSCPDLRKEAYSGKKIYKQLDDQSVKFIKNSKKGMRIAPDEKTIYVSKIFKWFKKDFKNVKDFLAPYGDDNRVYIVDKEYDVEYLPYDWSLNGK